MKYHFTNEEDCIEAIKGGNRAAFRYCFDLYYQRLCHYTSNFTLDFDQAEDIVQGVFIKLWNNREHLIITTSLKSYLYKSCYYKYIDLYRKKKNISEKLEEYRYQKLMNLEEKEADPKQEKITILNQAIQELPPKCREIFVLSKFDGLKYQEIADHLNISKKTVENQIGKAYSFLRDAVGNNLISITLLLAAILFLAF